MVSVYAFRGIISSSGYAKLFLPTPTALPASQELFSPMEYAYHAQLAVSAAPLKAYASSADLSLPTTGRLMLATRSVETDLGLPLPAMTGTTSTETDAVLTVK
jgi:hypothetical protein